MLEIDEAIAHVEDVAKENERIAFDLTTAFNMETIKSKECKKCANEHRQLAEWLRDYKRLKERGACEDAISRQAVHEAIVRWAGSMSVLIALPTRETIPLLDSIHKLPSVNPQEIRTGHWIDKDIRGSIEPYCSVCGDSVDTIYHYNYCPNCGAKMVESQESEGA